MGRTGFNDRPNNKIHLILLCERLKHFQRLLHSIKVDIRRRFDTERRVAGQCAFRKKKKTDTHICCLFNTSFHIGNVFRNLTGHFKLICSNLHIASADRYLLFRSSPFTNLRSRDQSMLFYLSVKIPADIPDVIACETALFI